MLGLGKELELGLWLRLKLNVRVCTSHGRSKLSAAGLYHGNERV